MPLCISFTVGYSLSEALYYTIIELTLPSLEGREMIGVSASLLNQVLYELRVETHW